MAVYFSIMGGLIFLILFFGLWARKLGKENQEARRIMDRLYEFVEMATVQAERGNISRAQEKALILEMREALITGSMIKSLRGLDEVIHDFYHGILFYEPPPLSLDEDQDGLV